MAEKTEKQVKQNKNWKKSTKPKVQGGTSKSKAVQNAKSAKAGQNEKSANAASTKKTSAKKSVKRTTQKKKTEKKKIYPHKLRIFALGGLNEIGKNMTVLECGEDIIIVDCGIGFPDDDMLGVDLVIPDFTYIQNNIHKVRGVFLTHGHEDHIGSLPYFLRSCNVRIYINNTWGWPRLYCWMGEVQVFGDFPGATYHGTEVVDGTTYFYWNIPEEYIGQTVNIISSNPSEGKQTKDMNNVDLSESRFFDLDWNSVDGEHLVQK